MSKLISKTQFFKIASLHKNIFLVSGKSFVRAKFNVKYGFTNDTYIVHRFSDFTENPTIEEVELGAKLFRQSNSSLIIAFGGGTAIDLAKLIKYYNAYHFTGNEVLPPDITDEKNEIPFIAIPTTFGTGSEATHFAVMYIDEKKYSVASNSLLPNYYILDSSSAFQLPVKVKASACLDALCQAIESYWSVGSTTESSKYAIEAITIIRLYYIKYLLASTDKINNAIAYAAHLAGKAINISKTTAPHAISYTLTSKFGVSHGHAVTLLCRNMFEVNSQKAIIDKNKRLTIIMNEIYSALNVEGHIDAKRVLNDFLHAGELESSFYNVGIIGEKEKNMIINGVDIIRLNNHPIKLQRSDLEYIITD